MADVEFRRVLQQDKRDVERLISSTLDEAIIRAGQIDPAYQMLLRVAKQTILAGGKRLRPVLALLAYRGYGGGKIDDVLPAVCAWELLHAGVLMHDDIIDRDTVRHGQNNISGTYNKLYAKSTTDTQHFADASAMLGGVLMIAESQRLVTSCKLDAKRRLQVLALLNDALFLVGGGELLDYESAFTPLEDVDSRKIALHKTASYSVTLPLMTGALLAGVSDDEQTKLTTFGNTVGIAFQLVDDVLGIFGDPAVTGKSVDVDLRERKRTLLAQEAFVRLSGSGKREFAELFAKDAELTTQEISRARQLIVGSGAREAIEAEIAVRTEEAHACIATLSMADTEKKHLATLVKMLLLRDA